MPRQDLSCIPALADFGQAEIRDYHTSNGYSAHPNYIWKHPALLTYGKPDPDAHYLWTVLSQEFRYAKKPVKVVIGKGLNAVTVEVGRGQTLVSYRRIARKLAKLAGKDKVTHSYVGHRLKRLEAKGAITLTKILGRDGQVAGTLVTDHLGVRTSRYDPASLYGGPKNLGRPFGHPQEAHQPQPEYSDSVSQLDRLLDRVSDDLKIGSSERKIPTPHPIEDNQRQETFPPKVEAKGPSFPSPQPESPATPVKTSSKRPSPQNIAKEEDLPPLCQLLLQAWQALGLDHSARSCQGYFLAVTIIAMMAALKKVKNNTQRLVTAMSLYAAKLDKGADRYQYTSSFKNFWVNGVWLEYLPPEEPQEAKTFRAWLKEELHPQDRDRLLGINIPKVDEDGTFEVHTTDDFKDFITHPNQSHILREIPFPLRWADPEVQQRHWQQQRIQASLLDYYQQQEHH